MMEFVTSKIKFLLHKLKIAMNMSQQMDPSTAKNVKSRSKNWHFRILFGYKNANIFYKMVLIQIMM